MKFKNTMGGLPPSTPFVQLLRRAGRLILIAIMLAGLWPANRLVISTASAQELSVQVIEQELKQLQRQILKVEEAAMSDPRVLAKHEEIQEGLKDYERFTKEFEPLKVAYQEMYDATDNLREVTRERAKTFPAAMAQQEIIDAADQRQRALRWDLAIGGMSFEHPDSPFNRMVDADPNYMALSEGKEPPEVESPEVKAWMMKTPLPDVRRAILLAIPEAKDLSVQLGAWSNEIGQVQTDLLKAKAELSQIRQNMQSGDDPVAAEAKDRLDNSLNEVSRARTLPEFREVVARKNASIVSLKNMAREIAREDPVVLELVQRRDALQKTKRTRAIEMSRKSRPPLPQK